MLLLLLLLLLPSPCRCHVACSDNFAVAVRPAVCCLLLSQSGLSLSPRVQRRRVWPAAAAELLAALAAVAAARLMASMAAAVGAQEVPAAAVTAGLLAGAWRFFGTSLTISIIGPFLGATKLMDSLAGAAATAELLAAAPTAELLAAAAAAGRPYESIEYAADVTFVYVPLPSLLPRPLFGMTGTGK